MSHILIISGHPNLAQSNTNAFILEKVASQFDTIEVRKLDQLYPDYQIDVTAEQSALSQCGYCRITVPFLLVLRAGVA